MTTIVATGVLAHQGGWDEILMVLVPLLVFAGLLALARRRAEDLDQDPASGAGDDDADDRERADPT